MPKGCRAPVKSKAGACACSRAARRLRSYCCRSRGARPISSCASSQHGAHDKPSFVYAGGRCVAVCRCAASLDRFPRVWRGVRIFGRADRVRTDRIADAARTVATGGDWCIELRSESGLREPVHAYIARNQFNLGALRRGRQACSSIRLTTRIVRCAKRSRTRRDRPRRSGAGARSAAWRRDRSERASWRLPGIACGNAISASFRPAAPQMTADASDRTSQPSPTRAACFPASAPRAIRSLQGLAPP